MKFDAARASAIFEKLGDPAFAGPDGEGRIADFVAAEFERMGWKVERREVEGSRFPQRAGPWIGWLGYGVLITVGFFVFARWNRDRVHSWHFSLVASAHAWFTPLFGINCDRWGRRRRPIEKAPVVIAARQPVNLRRRCGSSFRPFWAGSETDFLRSLRVRRFWIVTMMYAYLCLAACSSLLAYARGSRPQRLTVALAYVAIVTICAYAWVVILCVLAWEYRQSRSMQ